MQTLLKCLTIKKVKNALNYLLFNQSHLVIPQKRPNFALSTHKGNV